MSWEKRYDSRDKGTRTIPSTEFLSLGRTKVSKEKRHTTSELWRETCGHVTEVGVCTDDARMNLTGRNKIGGRTYEEGS